MDQNNCTKHMVESLSVRVSNTGLSHKSGLLLCVYCCNSIFVEINLVFLLYVC